MTAVFKYLKVCHLENERDLLSIVTEGRIKSSGFKLQRRRLRLKIRLYELYELPDCMNCQTREQATISNPPSFNGEAFISGPKCVS